MNDTITPKEWEELGRLRGVVEAYGLEPGDYLPDVINGVKTFIYTPDYSGPVWVLIGDGLETMVVILKEETMVIAR